MDTQDELSGSRTSASSDALCCTREDGEPTIPEAESFIRGTVIGFLFGVLCGALLMWIAA